MARVQVFCGEVEKGKIRLDHPESFKALLARLEGKDIVLRLAKHQRTRSLNQNAYVWGVVYPIFAEALGYDTEELHEALKHRFLRDREHERDGFVRVRSTAGLTTVEFCEYVRQVRQLAAEMGINIPDPGEME